MNTEFINTDNLPVETSRRLPDEDWFTPEHIQKEQELQHIRSTAPEHKHLIVSDTDPDGLGCVALAKEAKDDVGFIPGGPHGPVLDLETTFDELAEHTDIHTTVFVCDISPNEDTWKDLKDSLTALAENSAAVIWCDHHNYTDDMLSYLNDVTIEMRIGESESKCATDMLYEYLSDVYNPNWGDHIEALVAVTRDRDCWILEDERNQDIADFAETVDYERYIETVREHGPDLTDEIHDDLAAYRDGKQDLIDKALEETVIHKLDVTDNDSYSVDTLRVATVYGQCPSSDTAEAIRNTHDAHAVAMVKPSGALSLRGSDVFESCAAIATQFNGGGHDRAAGGFPAGTIFDSMLDFAAHWQNNGKEVTSATLMAFADVVDVDDVNSTV
jgi:oligoribonuclease NrnB/cAMP/cGMP phosphodiesterase (DHH superfamily)